jgi:hypothetical protein
MATWPQSENAPGTPQAFAVRHYTVEEIAELWRISEEFVRRLFEREPGVLVLGSSGASRHKRRYRTVRIPEPVLERVHKRLSRV